MLLTLNPTQTLCKCFLSRLTAEKVLFIVYLQVKWPLAFHSWHFLAEKLILFNVKIAVIIKALLG